MTLRFFLNLIALCLSFDLCLANNINYNDKLNQSANMVYGFADLVEPLMPAVVNISTSQKAESSSLENNPIPEFLPFENFNEFFEKFGIIPQSSFPNDKGPRKATSLGSGFIIDPAGFIATNYHVIAEAEEIMVKLSNDKELKATVIGHDAKTDLALLKVNYDKPLPFVKFGNSEKIRVGDWVVAIGNPFGLGGTVTAGIISSLSRDINTDGIVDNFIQTDTSINRGSSGGPLFNNKGEVIGINTAISNPYGPVNIGIAFAIPSTLADVIFDQLRKNGKVERGLLGVMVRGVDDEIVESLGLPNNKGALVVEVNKDSPASVAGILAGDIILSFDGKEISSNKKLARIVAETTVGKKVEIIFLRKNVSKTAYTILSEFKNSAKSKAVTHSSSEGAEISGIILSELNDELKTKYSLSSELEGLIITKINKNGLWSNRGLMRGDVIVSINQETVNKTSQFKKIINDVNKLKRKSVMLLINRKGESLFVTLPVK